MEDPLKVLFIFFEAGIPCPTICRFSGGEAHGHFFINKKTYSPPCRSSGYAYVLLLATEAGLGVTLPREERKHLLQEIDASPLPKEAGAGEAIATSENMPPLKN